MVAAPWVVTATLIFLLVTTVTSCPEKCECSTLEAKCFEASLNAVPKDLNSTINKLNISHNNISILRNGDLDHVRKLKSLLLNNNGIETVEREVFCMTEELTTLDLRNNKLTLIQRVLFRCLKQLEYLYLKNNTVTFIDPSLFEDNTNLTVIDLSDNYITEIGPNTFVHNKLIFLLNTQNNSITLPLSWTPESYTPFNVLNIHFTGTCSWSIMSYQSIPQHLDDLRRNGSSVLLRDLYDKTKSDVFQIFESKLQDDVFLIYDSTVDAVKTTSDIYLFCYSPRKSLWFWCNDNPYRTFDILFEKCDKNEKEISEMRTHECDFSSSESGKWELAGILLFVLITIIAVIRMTLLVTRLERINNRRNTW